MQMQRIDIAVQASGCNSKKSQSRGTWCQTERQKRGTDTLMSSQARLSMKRNPWLLTRELANPALLSISQCPVLGTSRAPKDGREPNPAGEREGKKKRACHHNYLPLYCIARVNNHVVESCPS